MEKGESIFEEQRILLAFRKDIVLRNIYWQQSTDTITIILIIIPIQQQFISPPASVVHSDGTVCSSRLN